MQGPDCAIRLAGQIFETLNSLSGRYLSFKFYEKPIASELSTLPMILAMDVFIRNSTGSIIHLISIKLMREKLKHRRNALKIIEFGPEKILCEMLGDEML